MGQKFLKLIPKLAAWNVYFMVDLYDIIGHGVWQFVYFALKTVGLPAVIRNTLQRLFSYSLLWGIISVPGEWVPDKTGNGCAGNFKRARTNHPDTTKVPARHMWETGSLNWGQFMLQRFIRFFEFAPFRKKLLCTPFSKKDRSRVPSHCTQFSTRYEIGCLLYTIFVLVH